MYKRNYLLYILLMVFLPITILLLSSNLALRVPETYVFHFNDSENVNRLYVDVSGSEIADDIAGYFNSFGRKEFQIYEDNGEFKDPLFKENETKAMKNFKGFLDISLWIGIILLILTVLIYIYIDRMREKKKTRFFGRVSAGISVAILIIFNIVTRCTGIRKTLIMKVAGVSLKEKSSLYILMGPPFYKTFLMFELISGIVLILIFLYINRKRTSINKIFF